MMRVAASRRPSFVRKIGNNQRVMAIGISSSATGRYLMTTSVATPNNLKSNKTLPSPPQQDQKRLFHRHAGSSSNNHRLTANVLFAVAAVVSLRPLMTMAEGRTRTASPEEESETFNPSTGNKVPKSRILKYVNGEACPVYGCPLFPVDIVARPPADPNHNHLHAPEALETLGEIRNKTRAELLVSPTKSATKQQQKQQSILSTTATSDKATITMCGFKGGNLTAQINQDRAFVVGPYYIDDPKSQKEADAATERRLFGVFDGHAARGELVSEYAVKQIGVLLAQKLKAALKPNGGVQDDEISTTKRVLHETFVELDATAPADPSGGCTATVVLQQGNDIYIANAGDSQSVIGIYRKKTQSTRIVYVSREDKPSLPDERARVEDMGGYVYIPVRGTSRVVYVNPRTGSQTGLAMSRSIGDWTFGKLGVVPDPIVDVLHISDIVKEELSRSRAEVSECWTVDDDGVISRTTDKTCDECQMQGEPPVPEDEEDDVYIFALSASDGMLDYVSKEGMAQVVAHSLFDDQSPHPATGCEMLVSTAAQGWDKYRQGRYRDDIAIAISTIRVPPPKDAATKSQKDEL